jgi:hypothetical protein
MMNIVLINFFFDIPTAAFLNSIGYTVALLYLLLLRWDDLKFVLWQSSSKLQPLKLGFLKYVFRIAAIGLAFGMIYYLVKPHPQHPFEGKWKVDQFIRNGDTAQNNAWITDGTIWKNIYVEDFGKLILSSNPYVFEKDRAQWADFKYEPVKRELQLIIERGWTEKDTTIVNVSNYDQKEMQWSTIFKGDTLFLALSKEK